MRSAVRRAWKYSTTPQARTLIKYTAVSVISSLTALVVLTLVYGVLRLWTEVPSVLFADIVAGIPSYFLNRQWVWGKSGRSHLWREVIPYWVTSLTGIGFAIVMASIARHVADVHHLHHVARTALVVGANVSAFATVWLLKFLILNRLFRQIDRADSSPSITDASGIPPEPQIAAWATPRTTTPDAMS